MARLEKHLWMVGDLIAKKGRHWISLSLQVLKSCGFREVGAMILRMLPEVTGYDPDLQSNWLGTSGKIAISNH